MKWVRTRLCDDKFTSLVQEKKPPCAATTRHVAYIPYLHFKNNLFFFLIEKGLRITWLRSEKERMTWFMITLLN